jgi:hypothetical protein
MGLMNWLLVVEGVGSVAGVAGAVVAVVGAVSARADRNRAEAAARTAAEVTAASTRTISEHLEAMVAHAAPEPLVLVEGLLRNVTGHPVTVTQILNMSEFSGRRPPVAVPTTIPAGESIEIPLDQRYSESPVPGSLSLRIDGREAPVTLHLPRVRSGEVWLF